MQARQTLLLDSNIVQVYEELNFDDGPKQTLQIDHGGIPPDTQRMIWDYMDVGHTKAALEIVTSCIASGRRPTLQITNMLAYNIIDNKVQSLTIPKRITLCRLSTEVLRLILETHGPRCFDHLWKCFKDTNPSRGKNRKSTPSVADDGEIMQDCGLERFDNFFAFVKSVLQPQETESGRETQAEHGLLLDFLIAVLEKDIRGRKGSYTEMKNAIIVQLLNGSAFKSNMVPELDSIFSCYDTTPGEISCATFEHRSVTDTPEYALSIRLLNLFVICAYTDGLLDTKSFEEETYRHFSRLHGRQCSYFLENVSNPAFVTILCGLAFSDSDLSLVSQESLHLKHTRNQVMKKIFEFDMMTRPISVNSVQDIWRHVTIMSKRISSYLESKTLRYEYSSGADSHVISGLTTEDMCLIWEHGAQAIEKWQDHVTAMLRLPQLKRNRDQDTTLDKEYQDMIQLTLEMTRLCLQVE